MTKKNNAALVRQGSHALVRSESRKEFITPAADIFETPAAFVLRLDMPGADRNDIQVGIQAERLSIKGRIVELHAETAEVLYHEIPGKSYYRTFNLTSGIASNRIEAEFQDGVLSITIPKSERFTTKEIRIQ